VRAGLGSTFPILMLTSDATIETMCWALTTLVLRAEMRLAERSEAEIANTIVWYDLTEANVKTNLAEDSRQMRDRGLLSEGAARRMSGIEETDKPTDEEMVRWVGAKVGNPWLATFGLEVHDKIDWEEAVKYNNRNSGPVEESPADPAETSPSKGAPGMPKPTPIRNAS